MPKVLGLVWDPTVSGQRLHQRYNWTDPFTALLKDKDAINMACGDLYSIEVKEIPQLALTRSTYNSDKLAEIDGQPTVYDGASWIRDWQAYGGNWSGWPNGGQLHVGYLLQTNNLVSLINNKTYDEVWLATPPVPAPFEGCMLFPENGTGYTAHDKKIAVPGLNRRFILHHPQMENWNLVHNYWHRVEAVLAHIWTRHVLGYCDWDFTDLTMQDVYTYAQLFTMTDLCRRGEAQVGTCHFMPNSKIGYVGNMDDAVPSGAHLWYDYPNGFPLDLQRKDRYKLVSGDTWKGFSPFAGAVNEHVWQLDHIPRGKRRVGITQEKHAGRWTDWWKYICDVNDETGINEDSPRPTVNQEPPLAVPISRYGDKYLVRISPHDGDPDGGGTYTVHADGTLTDSVIRRQREHNDISMETVTAKVWTISGPGWSYNMPGVEDVPVPALYTGEQLLAEAIKMHTGTGKYKLCPAPNRFEVNTYQDYILRWDSLGLSLTLQEDIPLAEAIRRYDTTYGLLYATKYCGVVVPPIDPPPVVPPIIVPSGAYERWRDARVLERKLWDEYKNSL